MRVYAEREPYNNVTRTVNNGYNNIIYCRGKKKK